jgi:nicotinamide mononucleotide (NMN) deamidase PncC
MSSPDIEPLVRQIHDSPTRLVLSFSGGGSDTLSGLLSVPGASRTVLEAVVPYSQQALCRWLAGRPDQFCSARTARAMAMSGFLRACEYESPEGYPLVGVGATASLATDRPKRGPHRIHLAVQTVRQTIVQSVELTKDLRRRPEEEIIASAVILNLIAEVCGIDERLPLNLQDGESIVRQEKTAPAAWNDLLLGKTEAILHDEPAGARKLSRALFSGAFNPIHVGHEEMVQVASQILGTEVDHEVSILNVDKPPLDYIEIGERIDQFGPEHSIWLTRAPTFVEKSRLFPAVTFVVGIDTLRRVAAPRYYRGSEAACAKAIDEIASRGCRFLVFGRSIGGSFIRLGDLDLPVPLASICREVPETQFRQDISSTEIRRQERLSRKANG